MRFLSVWWLTLCDSPLGFVYWAVVGGAAAASGGDTLCPLQIQEAHLTRRITHIIIVKM